MTRHGSVQERHLVLERIETDTRQGSPTMDSRIPIWNGDYDIVDPYFDLVATGEGM